MDDNDSLLRKYDDLVKRLLAASNSPDIELELLGNLETAGSVYPMYLVHIGKPDPKKLKVMISAGIHGDEPAGVEAALQFIEHNVENPTLLSHYYFLVYPCNNPYGWERGTRENAQGVDLNREFKVKNPPEEVKFILLGLAKGCFDLVYEMHEDYDSPGFYLYEVVADPSSYLGEAIIQEISAFGFNINRSYVIEGKRAKNGILRPNINTFRKTRLPKALYLYRVCGGHILTLETPSTYLPITERVRIHLLGLNVSLNRAWTHKDAMSGI